MFYAQVAAVMAGEAAPEAAEPLTLEFALYNAASKILAADRWHRERMVNDHPPGVRDLVCAEVLRLYKVRRDAYLLRKPEPPKVQIEKPQHRPEWDDYI